MRQRIINTQDQARSDDLGFGHLNQRCVNFEPTLTFDGRRRGEIRRRLERFYKLRPAVRVATIVDRINADENIERADHLGVTKCDRKENGIPGRDVGNGDARCIGGIFGDVDLIGQRARAESAGGA